ncbi:MAG: DUF4364 family protein [Clostridia bacterium]|nr:DUF4364 family protein [Clostridia bacterium]
MKKSNNDPIQNKLLMLFIFDKMEMPMSEDTLTNFCTCDDALIPYMDCKWSFGDLLKTGYLCEYKYSCKDLPLYIISEEGRICLAHFFARIPISQRELVSAIVKRDRMTFKRQQEYFSNYSKNSDGTYKVSLKINEPEKPVIEISMNVPSKEIAKSMYDSWEERAPKVFSSIYDILVDG